MSEMNGSTPPPEWLKHITAEAIALANRLASDFRISIDSALRFAPDPKDVSQRSQLLNEFFNVIPDVAARIVCDYGGCSLQIEHIFQEIVHKRFAHSRNEQHKRETEAKAAKPISAVPS